MVPEKPGFPQDTSLLFISLASILLVLTISSKYLFQSKNDNLGEFLKQIINYKKYLYLQGRRNSIISGEAAQVKERTRGEISKNYFSQPLKSGEADASSASPVPTPLYTYLVNQLFD